MSLSYKDFKDQLHPDYKPAYLERCRLLYEGGDSLLGNKRVMKELLPQHPAEPEGQYKIRRRMAYYENVVAEVLDFICSSLSQDPLRMAAKPEAPPFYDGFMDDTSPPAGKVCQLNNLVKQLVQGLLLYRCQWLRVDMPRPGSYPSLAHQEADGALRAYCVLLSPEHVQDWEFSEDGSGQLERVLLHDTVCRWGGLGAGRNLVIERYTLIDAAQSQVFEFAYDRGKQEGPNDSAEPRTLPAEPHGFGVVPVLRFEPPQEAQGLYAMALLEPLARRHLEAVNAKAYAEARVLFTPRTVFLDPGMPSQIQEGLSGAAESGERATEQPHGTASVVQMRAGVGTGDKVEYPAPPTDAFKYAAESCDALVEAMHRVVHQMALNVKSSAAALQRSGESKAQDKVASNVVLGALGEIARSFIATELYPMLARGRDPDNAGGEQDIEWSALGLERFDQSGLPERLADASQWVLLGIQSPRANQLFFAGVFRSAFGDRATEDDYIEMDKDLEAQFGVDQMAAQASAAAQTAIADQTAAGPAAAMKPQKVGRPA